MIEALGGSTATARKLQIPVTTVDSWRRKNNIPPWRLSTLVTAVIEARSGAAK